MTIDEIFNDIRKERAKQEKMWGQEFDDKNTINDWCSFITRYAGYATTYDIGGHIQREELLKAVTIGIAAIQAFDRNGGFPQRHYDDE